MEVLRRFVCPGVTAVLCALSVRADGPGLASPGTVEAVPLTCALQRMEGRATAEGLWLASTADAQPSAPLRVMAAAFGRGDMLDPLPPRGAVETNAGLTRWIRPRLVEEYSVTAEGIRQDFIIAEKPDGEGDLRVALAVEGANAEPSSSGATIVLHESGRRLAYSRLLVTDAVGNEIHSRMDVLADDRLVIVVQDVDARYPLRIDPTFSDDNWVSMGVAAGVNGTVRAVIADDDGNVYIGGSFTVAGGLGITNIAVWNGAHWASLGEGIAGGEVLAFALDGEGNVFVGGDFDAAGGQPVSGIAKWNGSVWTNLGSGVVGFGGVRSLAVDDQGNLYAGGNFYEAGGISAQNIAMWNGFAWTNLGAGTSGPGWVNALSVDGAGNLYIVGNFTNAGGVSARNVAKWNGSSWTNLGSGIDGWDNVHAVTIDGSGNLYVGGDFTDAGGVAVNHIARWSGSAWSDVGAHGIYPVYALATDQSNNLYSAGGSIFGTTNIARWNGSTWTNLGTGVDGPIYAITSRGDNSVLVAGNFHHAGGLEANSVARWSGDEWMVLGSGLSGWYVACVAVDPVTQSVYVSGLLGSAGGLPVDYIAKWNNGTWEQLGSPDLNSYVRAMVVDASGTLYVGGEFTTAGDVAASYVAKWTGTGWTNLGAGVNGPVEALAVDGDGSLYAGGYFTSAGDVSASYVAKWNGSAWTNMDSGVNYFVDSLIHDGSGNIVAGGQFWEAGDVDAVGVAKWNGTVWTNMGEFDAPVRDLAIDSAGIIYASGPFTSADGIDVNHIAKWTGSAWTNLGQGFSADTVQSLATDQAGNLYVGGYLTNAGGVAVNNIAKWNGSVWTNLGSGADGTVRTLASDHLGRLFVGGAFTVAGGKPSTYLALWQVQTGRFLNVSGTLAFGNVPTGTLDFADLFLYSGGAETVTVSSISYPPGFTGSWSGMLSPGSQTNVTVTFAPTALQSYGGAITINSDATGGGNTISCSGTGVAPSKLIGLSGDLAFGNVMTGQSANAALTVSNSGTLPLTVHSINYPPGFSGAWSGIVSPNSASNITVSFAPPAPQAYGGNITVDSDATNVGNIIPCSGTGVTYGALSRFTISPISSPQSTGAPFAISITAVDTFGNTVESFNGSVTIEGRVDGAFEDDVEGGTNDWTHGGVYDLWNISTNRSVSGSHSWYCGIFFMREYVNDMATWLVSPPVLLGSADNLTYQHWYETEPNYDFAYVEISTNDGASFETLSVWDGLGPGWEGQTNDLSAYAGQEIRVRFRFESDFSVTAEGWYIDDIRIGGSNLVMINPTNTGSFTNGMWTGPVTVFQPASNMYLWVRAGAGHTGTGNTFDVLSDGPVAPHDSDNDGLPDWWETAYGLNPAISNAPNSNADGDPLTDREEYIADTNPQSTNSFFPRVMLTNPPLGSISLVVDPTSTGRVYHVRWTTNLLADPQNWLLIPPEQTGSGGSVIFTITNDAPFRTYRTGVRLP